MTSCKPYRIRIWIAYRKVTLWRWASHASKDRYERALKRLERLKLRSSR